MNILYRSWQFINDCWFIGISLASFWLFYSWRISKAEQLEEAAADRGDIYG